jgi:hypothetical protein
MGLQADTVTHFESLGCAGREERALRARRRCEQLGLVVRGDVAEQVSTATRHDFGMPAADSEVACEQTSERAAFPTNR